MAPRFGEARGRIAFRAGSALADITESRLKLSALAVLVASVAGGFEFTIHEISSRIGVSPLAEAIVDASFVSLGSLAFALAWLSAHRARRQKVREEVEKIGTLNHEIRNALSIIVAAHYPAESRAAEMVLEGVNRIDRTLRELFPPPSHKHAGEIKPANANLRCQLNK